MNSKTIIFIYSKKRYVISPKSELMIDSLNNFSKAVKLNLSELYFCYKGKPVTINKPISKYTEKDIKIFVYNLKRNSEKENINQIICPECYNLALINIYSDKISISNCCNKHNTINLPLSEYTENQNINEKKITCDICGNSQNLYGEKLIICTCGQKSCG